MHYKKYILRCLAACFCSMFVIVGAAKPQPESHQSTTSSVNGDVNGDGRVDVNDVNMLINIILETDQGGVPVTRTYEVHGVTFTMVNVEGGSFTMGATEEQGSDALANEYPAHQVTLSDYCIGQTEVTQELWQEVMGYNHSDFNGEFDPLHLQRPVTTVTWDECQTFITKLNELTGATFRLPTEAEWEYAARGGKHSKGYKYAGSDNIDEVAWYVENSYYGDGVLIADFTTMPVGTKLPNELGLYDMNGNVSELCSDWYGPYSEECQVNPTGPAVGEHRSSRGGGWIHEAEYCRVSTRLYGTGGNVAGLRLAQ